MADLFSNVMQIQWQMVVMWAIGGLLIWLAIKKEMEPTLLLPMGFGAILVNLPFSGAVDQTYPTGVEHGPIDVLFNAGIANELFPLLLFIGIGAMIDFGPLLANPKMMLFGAAAQFGIFFTLSLARFLGFSLEDAASIAIIGAADGPTSIFVSQYFNSNYRRDYCGRLFLYGAGPHRAACGHQADHHQKGTANQDGLRPLGGFQAGAHPVPCSHHRNRRHYCSPLGSAGRLFNVRKPYSGMRRAGQSFPVGSKRAG